MDEFVRELKAEGISEVYYIGNLEKEAGFYSWICEDSVDDKRYGHSVWQEIGGK